MIGGDFMAVYDANNLDIEAVRKDGIIELYVVSSGFFDDSAQVVVLFIAYYSVYAQLIAHIQSAESVLFAPAEAVHNTAGVNIVLQNGKHIFIGGKVISRAAFSAMQNYRHIQFGGQFKLDVKSVFLHFSVLGAAFIFVIIKADFAKGFYFRLEKVNFQLFKGL